MNKQMLAMIAVVSVAFLIFYGVKQGSENGGGNWQNDIRWADAGLTKDQLTTGGKPVYLFFYTDWCTFCKKMERETFADATVQKYLNDRFVAIAINPETAGVTHFMGEELSYKDLAARLGVNGYPASFFFTAEGTLIGGQPGYLEPTLFADLTQYVGGGYYTTYKFPDFQKLPREKRS